MQPARMKAEPTLASASLSGFGENSVESEFDQTSQNIAAVRQFYLREEGKLSPSQRILERFSRFIGRPVFLGIILVFVAVWTASNTAMHELGSAEFDPAPFFWLQGIVGLSALLTTIVVLTKQNRLAKLAVQRAHLDLKVTLLTEQKAAKLIDLLEELRRDLPNVKDRHDCDATALKQAMNPELVLATLDERRELEEVVKSALEVAEDAVGTERDLRHFT
jgi:uncharacterized membrane protein